MIGGSGQVSRRAMLGGIGLGAAGLLGGGLYLFEDRPAAGSAAVDVAKWRRLRGRRYYIGHRGSGDVRPEHTMPAYQAAADWGAHALEVSTSSTSDGVLVCMHDLTLDRTTNGTGLVNAHTWAELTKLGVTQPELGPAWANTPIPRLEDVLDAFGGRLVLCLEAKRYEDYPLMMDLIAKRGLQRSVIVKAYHLSQAVADAKSTGYPVFSYLGVPDVSMDAIAQAAKPLDRRTDYLVLPTTAGAVTNCCPSRTSGPPWPPACRSGCIRCTGATRPTTSPASGCPAWSPPATGTSPPTRRAPGSTPGTPRRWRPAR